MFLDPNTLSPDGTTSVSSLSFSPSGKLAAYQKSEGGADWRSVEVLNAETLSVIDRIDDVKFSGIAWRGEAGFYYSRYDVQVGEELTAKADQHRLYFHKVGQPQATDDVVFGDGETFRYVSGYVTEDQRFLVVYASNTTAGNRLLVMDLNDPRGQLVNVVDDETSDISVIFSQDSMLYALTNRAAPNSRLVKFNLQAPTAWHDVIPESEHVLDASAVGGYFFAQYMVDSIARIEQYSLDGQRLREIELPGPGDASGFRGKAKDTVAYYSFQNYKTPSTLFRLELASGTS